MFVLTAKNLQQEMATSVVELLNRERTFHSLRLRAKKKMCANDEVLCHEAAHAAVRLLHGDWARPHGPEWRGLMALAGMPARVKIPASEIPVCRRPSKNAADVWEHRCPACQATRFAKTRGTRWRCRGCREAGHSGELLVERAPNPMVVDG